MYFNRLILAVISAASIFFTCQSGAAPAVKQLGGVTSNNLQGKTNQESLTKLSTTGTPSVRTLGLSTKNPTNVTSNTLNQTLKPSETANSVRLSGLHSNLVKGIGSKLSSNLSSKPSGGSAATSDLTQRVINLEIEMANKQGILEPGEGIDIDGNTIGLSDEILTLSEQMEEIAQEIDNLKEQFNTDNYYTISETEAYFKENYYTKEDIDTVVGKFSSAKIVDHFDPGFLHLPSTVQP